MKLTTKTVEVKEEAYTYEEQTWTCEDCGYVTQDEEDSKAHYGKSHSFKSKKEAGGYTFLWFENAEDYRAYHQDWEDSYGDLAYDGEYFKGPGWYGLKSVPIPCRCGSCGNYATYGVPGAELRTELFNQIEALEEKHDEIHDLLNTHPQ